jgi:transposase InsO family protein
MPWDVSTMSDRRLEFVHFVRSGGCVSRLCRQFGISRKTGYKWLQRETLEDLPRRPHTFPGQTPAHIEAEVVALALVQPLWGARKIQAALIRQGVPAPAPSTVLAILKRNGMQRQTQAPAGPWQRFEHPQPNHLWQMDFKGHFALQSGSERCHPFTVLDDHSRFSLCIRACVKETLGTVQDALEATFCTYGLPHAILCDNGSPWGGGFTQLEAWLLRQGVGLWHGRAYHPQTQGKLERFHRTLKLEAIQGANLRSIEECQRAFDAFRQTYNLQRPHQALDMDVPANRYIPSSKEFQDPPIAPIYPKGAIMRKVQQGGEVWLNGTELKVSKGLAGQTIAFNPTQNNSYEILFCNKKLATIVLNQQAKTVTYVPEHL